MHEVRPSVPGQLPLGPRSLLVIRGEGLLEAGAPRGGKRHGSESGILLGCLLGDPMTYGRAPTSLLPRTQRQNLPAWPWVGGGG